MTELREEPYVVPGAHLGPENPLPEFCDPSRDAAVTTDDSVSAEDKRYLGWATGFRVLPYRMQDQYDRARDPKTFRGLILENEFLRATFLPELNGRLASLIYKPANRELLHRNPVFQPANLALRNAWLSGGVEWNMGQVGHNYFTCSPVFTASLTSPAGYPILRIYEWERAKAFPWQVDFHLPPNSPFLIAHVRLLNPNPTEIPMYWWTNIAVDEHPGGRAIMPVDSVLRHNAKSCLVNTPMPTVDGRDISYPTTAPCAQEMFGRIAPEQRPWVTYLAPNGSGLIHTSTSRLHARKMFCWGMNAGGRRWQEFLAEPGCAYVEIQAGLARTQMHSIPMPAGAEWSWTEAFGLIETDPAVTQGTNWTQAWRAVDSQLEQKLPQTLLDDFHTQCNQCAVRPIENMIQTASGWGALEMHRRHRAGQPVLWSEAAPFPEATLGEQQKPWLTLLDIEKLPEGDPQEDPGAYMTQSEWREHLESALAARHHGSHWLSWLHLGIMRLEAGDVEGALDAWRHSIARTPSSWAKRNIAVIEQRQEHLESARTLLMEAWDLGPKTIFLAIECARILDQLNAHDELDAFIRALPESQRNNERIAILAAKEALHRGDYATVEALFTRSFATNREGETTLTDLWFALHEHRISAKEGIPIDDALKARVRRECPPPSAIDFRMVAEVE